MQGEGRRPATSKMILPAKPDVSDIRSMTLADLERVAAVERLCYAHPWSTEQFRRELENPLATVDLFWQNGVVAGFLCSWYVQGEMEIHNVATHPAFRRQGVARKLLQHALDRARKRRLDRAFLEVRVGNQEAIALYRAFGFRPIATRKGYYPDGEDALVMELGENKVLNVNR